MTKLTVKEWESFKRSTKCHICLKNFKDDDRKVRDHCHYTGKYSGPAHNSCNLRHRIPLLFP